MKRSVLFLVLMASACAAPRAADAPAATATAASSAASGAVVKPTFAWKPGTQLGVVERIEDSSDASVVAFHYDMRVEPAPEGLRVAFSNVRVEGAGAEPSMDAMAKLAPTFKPDWLVTSQGAFARVDVDDARIAKTLASWKAPPEMAQMFTELLAASAKNGAKEDFRELVELWANRPMSAGAPARAEATYDLGLFGPHAFDATLTFAGYAPCDAAKPPTCAKLVSDATSKDEKRTDDESIHVHRVFELLADPATLLPVKSTLRVDTRIATHGSTKENTIRVERTYASR